MLKLSDSRVAVKICGLTCAEDAVAAVEAGADLLGFNSWLGSKRYLDIENCAGWLSELPVSRVALMVNATLDEAARMATHAYVDAIQLHGDEDATYCTLAAALGKPTIKAIRVRNTDSLAGANEYSTSNILLDGNVAGEYGGTGTRFDWGFAQQFKQRFPKLHLWLAGGLTPENVAEAVASVRPAVVDVSSGVESRPGRKDFSKMRELVAAVREAER